DARPLAGAPELHDVHAVVVCLEQSGQRAALAERRDVSGRPNGAHLGHRPKPSVRHPADESRTCEADRTRSDPAIHSPGSHWESSDVPERPLAALPNVEWRRGNARTIPKPAEESSRAY